jgi:hypothetical protein
LYLIIKPYGGPQVAGQVNVTTVPGAKIKQALVDYGGCAST